MAVPVNGEGAALDGQFSILPGQGDILHQGQGGAGSFLGFRYGCVKGIEIGNALPCRHGSHRGIAAAAFAGFSVHIVPGMGDDVDGFASRSGDIRSRVLSRLSDGIDVYQLCAIRVVGQGLPRRQKVAQSGG